MNIFMSTYLTFKQNGQVYWKIKLTNTEKYNLNKTLVEHIYLKHWLVNVHFLKKHVLNNIIVEYHNLAEKL